MNYSQEVQELIHCIELIYNPQTDPQQRQLAQNFCDNFKNNIDNLETAFEISQNGEFSATVRYFGYHYLEHIMRNVEESNVDLKQNLKSKILHLFSTPNNILQEKTFIKEKIVSLLNEIVKREWPQRWPNLLEELISLADKGFSERELCLIFIRSFSDELYIYIEAKDISDHRRKNLKISFSKEIPKIIQFMVKILEEHYQKFAQIRDLAQSQENQPQIQDKIEMENEYQSHLKILVATLKAFTSLIDWIPSSEIYRNSLLLAFCNLLTEPELRMFAIDCLIVFGSKTQKISMIRDKKEQLYQLISTICRFSDSLLEENSLEQDYAFQKKFCQFLTIFTQNNSVLFSKPKDEQKKTISEFLDLMLKFSNHSSLMVSSFVLPFWIHILRKTSLLDQESTNQLLSNIFDFSLIKLVKVNFEENETNPANKYIMIDFLIESEFIEFYKMYRKKLVKLLQILGQKYPLFSLNRWLNILGEAFEGSAQDSSFVSYNQMKALSLGIQAILSRISNKKRQMYKVQQSIENVKKAVNYLLTFQTTDPKFLAQIFSILTSLCLFLNEKTEEIQKILSHLFSYITYKTESDDQQSTKLTEGTQKIRIKASEEILRLCQGESKALLKFLPDLTQNFQTLTSNQEIGDEERNNLLKSLVSVSNESKTFNLQEQLLETILNQYVSDLTQLNFIGGDEEIQQFVSIIGLSLNNIKNIQELANYANNRRKITSLLTLFYEVLKSSEVPKNPKEKSKGDFGPFKIENNVYGTKKPITKIAESILPIIAKLIKSIHSIYDPKIYGNLFTQEQSQYISSFKHHEELIDPELKGLIYRNENVSENVDLNILMNTLISGIVKWMFSTLKLCYQIIGIFCENNDLFYTIPGIDLLIQNFVLSSAENLPDSLLHLLSEKVLLNFLLNCPLSQYDLLINPIFSPILDFFGNKTLNGWQTLSNLNQNIISGEQFEEFKFEEDLKDFTDSYILLIQNLVCQYNNAFMEIFPDSNQKVFVQQKKKTDKTKKKAKNSEKNIKKVFSSQKLSESLLNSITILFKIEDPFIIKRITPLCYPLIVTGQKISDNVRKYISNSLLRSLIQSLKISNLDESLYQNLLSLILQIYSSQKQSTINILQEISQTDYQKIQSLDSKMSNFKNFSKKKKLLEEFFQEQMGIIFHDKPKTRITEIPQKLFIKGNKKINKLKSKTKKKQNRQNRITQKKKKVSQKKKKVVPKKNQRKKSKKKQARKVFLDLSSLDKKL
ncbi:exportin-5 [Anaeramoeba ignava]|uniref:Exportin-5 n=1 Tax=Anaeramoeba ignava TaxID=1746090 RepID=A0A9Q0LLS3_ANAIG|nr:exportin-5 [Anaeramoeba ignava]